MSGEAAISSGDPQRTRDELIEEYAPLVKYIAERLSARLPSSIEVEDLINTGVLGLIDAIDKFIAERGVKFKTYAEFRIRGAMLDYLRRQDWAPRSMRRKEKELAGVFRRLEQKLQRQASHEEAAEELGVSMEEFNVLLYKARGLSILSLNRPRSDDGDEDAKELGDFIPDEPENSPYELLKKQEVRDLMARQIDGLPEKERLVVSLYYFNELTMKEVGHVLGVTESRVSQLHSSAVLRLRGCLEGLL
ncbi:MAG: FliA/WhiG family RNA polymerase sigma factor [Deferrisomatales bacterium]|nr:FliA/WhiG family RNA polymerase sigma factor [Deferrisomatales bacterium]